MKLNGVDIWEQVRTLPSGTVIPKPRAKAYFRIKGLGHRRKEEAIIYTIPNHRNREKPSQKGITKSEWQQAFNQLATSGDFSRSWFNDNLPACAVEGACNFTTIGGIFIKLGYAEYDGPNSRYCKQ